MLTLAKLGLYFSWMRQNLETFTCEKMNNDVSIFQWESLPASCYFLLQTTDNYIFYLLVILKLQQNNVLYLLFNVHDSWFITIHIIPSCKKMLVFHCSPTMWSTGWARYSPMPHMPYSRETNKHSEIAAFLGEGRIAQLTLCLLGRLLSVLEKVNFLIASVYNILWLISMLFLVLQKYSCVFYIFPWVSDFHCRNTKLLPVIFDFYTFVSLRLL